MDDVTINFITINEEHETCRLVLVEEPWAGSTSQHLHALQDRLYGCLEAALDGQLAERFPESVGKTVVIQIDCYDVDREQVDQFVGRFAEGVAALPEYSAEASPFVRGYRFEVNHDSLRRPT